MSQLVDAIIASRNAASRLAVDQEFHELLSKADYGPGFALLPLLLGPCVQSDILRSRARLRLFYCCFSRWFSKHSYCPYQ